MDLAAYVQARGGFARRATLVEAGVRDSDLRSAVSRGLVVRIRPGWYAHPEADQDAMAAVRAGGRLACASALRSAGVWALPDRRLHVAYASGGHRRPDPRLRIHTGRLSAGMGANFGVESILEALERLSRCSTAPAFVVAADSALNKKLVTLGAIDAVVGGSVRSDRLVAALDARSESGTESLARLALRRCGISLQPQVEIAGVGRVDVVVGDRLVVELDSWRWHSDRAAFERDRRRDLALASRGYLVVRLSYRRVLHDWAAVERDLVRIVRSGEHRWRGPTRRLSR